MGLNSMVGGGYDWISLDGSLDLALDFLANWTFKFTMMLPKRRMIDTHGRYVATGTVDPTAEIESQVYQPPELKKIDRTSKPAVRKFHAIKKLGNGPQESRISAAATILTFHTIQEHLDRSIWLNVSQLESVWH
jgi:hypothetical protein